MRFILSVFIISCFSAALTYAQIQHAVQSQYRFKSITVDQGLSNNNVRSICQDSKGFIWIATLNGVDKFDGQTIVSYRHDPNISSTLSSNTINSLFLDSKNNLWIGNVGGLDLYNSDFDNFRRFSHKDINGQIENVEDIAEDKDGKLWIGAKKGLYVFDLNNSGLQYFSNEPDNVHGIPSSQIFRILVDSDNNVWISILNEGICVYNQSDENFLCFRNDPSDPSTISGNRIERFYEDSNGRIWIGTFNNGLNLFEPDNSSFIRIIPDPDNSYSTRVRAIFEDMQGNFFIGTRGGLYLLNNLSNEFVHYAYEGHNFSNLSQNSILGSFIDKTGTLWIGTFSGGINYTNLNKKEFVHYPAGKDDNHFLSGSNVYAISEDPEGNLWVGADNGLNYLNRTNHSFTYFSNNPDDPYSLSYNDIKALEWDKLGNLWIGTNRGGLNLYNAETGRFQSYRHDPFISTSLSGDKLYGLMADINNDLWILTNTNIDNQYSSIDILPNGSDKFIHLNEQGYFGFEQNDNGDVFIGGINGFWIFTRYDSTYNFVSNDSLIGKVNTIRRDSENRLWIGSEKGLVRYNLENKSFVWFSEDNGYPISTVFGILEDNSKNLWISTNFGLVKSTNIVEKIDSVTFRIFDKDDGLQSKQFNYNAFYKCRSGEMAFGGINGINTFYPDDIVENPVAPKVVLTDLKIFNETTPIGELVRGRLILEKSISVTDEIELGRKQNVFTIEFAALHYANPEKNTFKYKLDGFDENWQFRKAGNNYASYTNLPAGEYTFLVTAANNDGVWNKEPVELKITIIPPFWKRGWFIALIIFLVIAGSWMIMKMREKQLKADKERLESELNIGKAEIEKQKNEIREQEEARRLKEEQEGKIRWHNEGIVKFSEIISSNKESEEKLSQAVLSNLVSYVEADQGGIFLLNDDNQNEENKELELVASYAYSQKKLQKKRFLSGEGLIGTCYKNNEITIINNLPQDYTSVSSGLGKASPEHLVLVPIKLAEYKIGVLELTSFKKIDEYKVDFIEKITENITSIISIVRGGRQAEQAVMQLNEQAEELQAQEEELRQNMEEMQATQDELLRKQQEFENENAMFETLLAFLQDRITFKDPESIYLRINKTKSDALKLKDPKDAIGLSDADFFGEEHFKKAYIDEKKLFDSGKAVLNNEEQIKFKDGRVQWGSTSRIPFRNSKGDMVGTLIITKNITDQKLLSGQYDNQIALLKELATTHPLICYEANHLGILNQIFGSGLDLLGLKSKDLKNADIYTVFDELGDELSIENLKESMNIEYKLITETKSFRLVHKIVKNVSSGGIMGCAEVIEN